ncbi:MAG TPA: hypothetical protein VGM88_25540 [Kofleriaceae bacterium]|jgi:hypothetical protein
MRLLLLAVALAACNVSAPPSPSLPWIRGLAPTGTSDTETQAASERLAVAVGASDEEDDAALDVTTPDGAVLASYERGVALLDAHGAVVARAPGFVREGSADDLVALAVGDAQLDRPVIVLAVTSGGHRTSTTSVLVYQQRGRRLAKLFDEVLEERDGEEIVAGTLAFVPQGLLYRRPNGRLEEWVFDANRDAYVRPAALAP